MSAQWGGGGGIKKLGCFIKLGQSIMKYDFKSAPWLLEAIEQHPEQVSLYLAYSLPYLLDTLEDEPIAPLYPRRREVEDEN